MTRYSGVYYGGTSAPTAEAFFNWRGTPVTLAPRNYTPFGMSFPGSATWAGIQAPSDALALKGTEFESGNLGTTKGPTWTPWMFSIKMLPNDTSTTLALGASGAYDDYWVNTATYLVSQNQGSCLLRTGWEFNRNSNRWNINGYTGAAADYAAYHRNIFAAMMSVPGADFKFIWCPGVGTTSSLPDPVLAYPGADFVWGICPDGYDKWFNHYYSTVTPQQRWQQLLYGLNAPDGTPRGFVYYRDMAVAQNKVYGWPEWGLWDIASMSGSVTQGGGGDDPYYMQVALDFLTDCEQTYGLTVLDCYFNADASDGAHKIYPAGTQDYSQAAAVYQAAFPEPSTPPPSPVYIDLAQASVSVTAPPPAPAAVDIASTSATTAQINVDIAGSYATVTGSTPPTPPPPSTTELRQAGWGMVIGEQVVGAA